MNNKTVHQLGYYERNEKTCEDCKHYPCMVHDIDANYKLPLCPQFNLKVSDSNELS
jgi:hypothetical protein